MGDDLYFNEAQFQEILHGIELFNAEKFWECHEALEDVWLENAHCPSRYIPWAIIQAATSLYHVRNNNLAGAQGMLQKAKEKLKKCSELSLESPFLLKRINWLEFREKVLAVPVQSQLSDFDDLYQFKFIMSRVKNE